MALIKNLVFENIRKAYEFITDERNDSVERLLMLGVAIFVGIIVIFAVVSLVFLVIEILKTAVIVAGVAALAYGGYKLFGHKLKK